MSLAALALATTLSLTGSPATDDRVLVFTRTEGYRHESIPAGVAMLRDLAARRGLRVEATEDPRRFTNRNLRGVRALVFLQTSENVLDPPQERAVERFVRRGGGWLGIHGAGDAERAWGCYVDGLVGTRVAGHGGIVPATVVAEDRAHPATRDVPRRWTRVDEWYDFRSNPRPRVHVVATLDVGSDHPIAWWRRAGRGRSFYTALGHTTASYAEPAFRRHIGGALAWVARRR